MFIVSSFPLFHKPHSLAIITDFHRAFLSLLPISLFLWKSRQKRAMVKVYEYFQTKELNGYEKIAQGRLCRYAPRLPPRGRPARRREDRPGRPHLPRRGKKRRGDGRFRLLPLPRLHRRAHALRSRRVQHDHRRRFRVRHPQRHPRRHDHHHRLRLPEQGRDACLRSWSLAQKGRRQMLVRLRLPHDHRRLERGHRGRAGRYVRRRHHVL